MSEEFRHRLHEIIFEADTKAGRAFDIFLFLLIALSILAVMLDSVGWINESYGYEFYLVEWLFTIVFTIEYVFRLISVRRPFAYARSFFGIIDLLAILPTYISIFFPGTQYLLVIRVLRVLRVFRVLKLVNHISASQELLRTMRRTRTKITVFFFFIVTLVIILGSLMYLIEGPEAGFTSIPKGVYWGVVTLTTVGYGDISPQTNLGQLLAAVVMILGYAIIAVPTGIVTAELTRGQLSLSTQMCRTCNRGGHDADAVHCKFCGDPLNDRPA